MLWAMFLDALIYIGTFLAIVVFGVLVLVFWAAVYIAMRIVLDMVYPTLSRIRIFGIKIF